MSYLNKTCLYTYSENASLHRRTKFQNLVILIINKFLITKIIKSFNKFSLWIIINNRRFPQFF